MSAAKANSREIPEDCTPATYKLVRQFFVDNELDGSDDGMVTYRAAALADAVAELFSCDDWRQAWNQALIEALNLDEGNDR